MAPARLLSWFRRTLILAIALTFIVGAKSDLHAQGSLVEALIPYARQDYEKATKLLSPLASQGDAIAQLTLGRMHLRGEGVPQDSFAAFEWHRKAAEQGNPAAQYELGVMVRDGLGTAADGQLALQWFKRAADRGTPAAFNAIGELYLGHHDVPQDFRIAFDWFSAGAEMDNAEAMYNLGMHHALGRDGTPPNEVEAFKWFDLAAGFAADHVHDNAVRARMALAERLTPLQIWAAKVEAQRWKQNVCCSQKFLSDRGGAPVRVE
jgi:TPR repeat protein